MDTAHQLKEVKYLDLINHAEGNGYKVKFITVEMGLRGLIGMLGFDLLEEELDVSTKMLDVLLLPIMQ